MLILCIFEHICFQLTTNKDRNCETRSTNREDNEIFKTKVEKHKGKVLEVNFTNMFMCSFYKRISKKYRKITKSPIPLPFALLWSARINVASKTLVKSTPDVAAAMREQLSRRMERICRRRRYHVVLLNMQIAVVHSILIIYTQILWPKAHVTRDTRQYCDQKIKRYCDTW